MKTEKTEAVADNYLCRKKNLTINKTDRNMIEKGQLASMC